MENTEQLYAGDHLPALQLGSSEIGPNNPPWNGWIAVAVWVASVLAILVIPTVMVAVYVLPKAGQFAGNSADFIEFVKTDPTAVILQVVGIIPAHILTILLAWIVVTKFRKYSFRTTLGWDFGGMLWWHYGAILVGIFVLSMLVTNLYPEADNDLLRILRSSRAAVFIVAALATFTAPLVEEVIYRGILYSAFQRAFGMAFSVVIVTALFAAVHFPQYWPSYSTLALLTVLSLTLTLVRVKTKNLLPCIILHTIFNGSQSILLVLEPYLSKTAPDVEAALIQLFK